MGGYQSIIKDEGLYWGQDEISSWLDRPRQSALLELETSSWLSDLYWGEFLALRFARIRMENAPISRKKIWERISIDEMLHFSLISRWFADRKQLPSPQNMLFRTLSAGLHEVEMNPNDEGIARLGELQVFLEALIHKLIGWRKDLVVDSELKELLDRVSQDEIVHIHASLFELKKTGDDLGETELLRRHKDQLFPLHFARRILNRDEFRRARFIGSQIVSRVILDEHAGAAV